MTISFIPTITGQRAAQARGIGAPARRLRSGMLSGRRRPCASKGPRSWEAERERSDSTHAMQISKCKLGNCACEQ
eukprot:6199297-Pleurochrysis_carterae.AAC.1